MDAGGALPSGLETQKPRDARACLAAVRALGRAAPDSAVLEPPPP
jgi:hypothetical protein